MTEPVTEFDPRPTGPQAEAQAQIDGLLRRSMAAPIPTLPLDFNQRLMREVHRRSQPAEHYRRIFLAGYALVSALACAVVMLGQGLGWGTTAAMILTPLVLLAAARSARRTTAMTVR